MYQYFVYILKCSDNSYYTGITNNLERRLNEHNFGKNKNTYTYSRRPIKVEFHEVFSDVLQAIYFEKKLKGWTRAKKQALIDGDFDMLKILAECKMQHIINITELKVTFTKHFDCAQCDILTIN